MKADWIRGLLDTFNVNCFQLQEHFKASKTVNSLFKREFELYEGYVVPAVRDHLN